MGTAHQLREGNRGRTHHDRAGQGQQIARRYPSVDRRLPRVLRERRRLVHARLERLGLLGTHRIPAGREVPRYARERKVQLRHQAGALEQGDILLLHRRFLHRQLRGHQDGGAHRRNQEIHRREGQPQRQRHAGRGLPQHPRQNDKRRGEAVLSEIHQADAPRH